MSFMKEIFAVNMAFAALLVISAEGISIKNHRVAVPGERKESLSKVFCDCSLSTPTTMRSGCMKSSMAAPVLMNSGIEATTKPKETPREPRADATALPFQQCPLERLI